MFAGFVRLRPSLPKMPGVVWNINTVLDYIRSRPGNKELTIIELSAKTAFLLLITSTRRRSDIMGIHLDHIYRDANHFVCRLQTLCKTYSLKNTSCQILEITKFPSDKRVYPYNALAWYLYRTKSVRTMCKWLFITTTTHNEAAPSTISRWVKFFMAEAGIDIATFQPHSTRSASASYLLALHVPLDDILKKGSWSCPSTFKKHYARVVNTIDCSLQKIGEDKRPQPQKKSNQWFTCSGCVNCSAHTATDHTGPHPDFNNQHASRYESSGVTVFNGTW